MKKDSLDKILEYMKELKRDYLYFSQDFFRTLGCPPLCGGCCTLSFSKDFLEVSERWKRFKAFYPDLVPLFTVRKKGGVSVFSFEEEKGILKCSFLDEVGRCTIHRANPFTCEFETLKLRVEVNAKRKGKDCTTLHDRCGFGRGWALTRVDGQKGALCELSPFTKLTEKAFISKLNLLKELQDYICKFEGEPSKKLEVVISFIEVNKELILKGQFDKGFFIDEEQKIYKNL